MDTFIHYNYNALWQKLLKSKVVIIVVLLLVGLILGAYIFISSNSAIKTDDLTDDSSVSGDKNNVRYSIYAKNEYVYKSNKTGQDAAKDFITKNPTIDGKKLLPDDFLESSDLVRSFKDTQDGNLGSALQNKTGEHYYYRQKIKNFPVFGSEVAVHVRNGNEVYAVGGNVIFNTSITEEKISTDKAKEIALKDAVHDREIANFRVKSEEKMIFNLSVFGISSDDTNNLVLVVEVEGINGEIFDTKYFVSLLNGKVLYIEELIHEVINREVRDCKNAADASGCATVIGSEGNPPPSSNQDGSDAYQYFGEIYNYFKSSFGRDSFDNNGGKLIGNVHLGVNYQNAFWSGTEMYFGDGMVIKDVTAHEVTHGITKRTANLTYAWQSGALNEAVSDIFGSALDNNWTMGEGSSIGIIRRMDEPTQSKIPQPDKVFSQRYYCVAAGSSCVKANDFCGVHRNSGVLNKAFYLMTDGGSFNGCNIGGVGRTKAHAVVYRALTTYLSASSNFKQMYQAVLAACSDLYTSSSSECGQVKSAMQATEMDQQPDGTQTGALCGGVTPKVPLCAGSSTTGTGTGTGSTGGSSTGGSGSTTGTTSPDKHMISGLAYSDQNRNLLVDSGEGGVGGVTLVLEGPTTGTVQSSSDGTFAFNDLTGGKYKLTVKVQSIILLEYPDIDISQMGVSYSLEIPIFPEFQKLIDELGTNIPTATPGGGSGTTSNSLTPSPTPITIYSCKQKTKTQIVAGKQIQISYLDCTPTGTVQPKVTSKP